MPQAPLNQWLRALPLVQGVIVQEWVLQRQELQRLLCLLHVKALMLQHECVVHHRTVSFDSCVDFQFKL